jgi:uncharacterized protein YbaP (TraB family)
MKRLLPALGALCVGLLSGSWAYAQSPVWKVSDGENFLYLGGSVHILRAGDFPLPEPFERAYTDAAKLIFEVDPAAMEDPQTAQLILQKGMYQDGRSLPSVLHPDTYAALAAYCEANGFPTVMLNNMKPGLVMVMLSVEALRKLGLSQEGVDMHFAAQARKDGKNIGSLETVEFQINMITEMTEGHADAIVLQGLEDLEQNITAEAIDEMIAAWRSGNLTTIESLVIDPMREFPELFELIFTARNASWIPQIEAQLATPEIEFVVVGVGHLPGPDGVLSLLRSAGYTVEPLLPADDAD